MIIFTARNITVKVTCSSAMDINPVQRYNKYFELNNKI